MKKRIKIVQIVEALGGGLYSYFIDLTKVLGENSDIESVVIYSDKRPEILPQKVKIDFHSRNRLVKVSMEKEIAPLKDWGSIKVLSKIFKEEVPDIIHLHSSKVSVIGRIAYKFSKSKAKIFYTPHGYAFLQKDISSVKRFFYYNIERLMALIAGSTISCGDTEYEYAKKLGKSILVRNGVHIKELTKFYKNRSHKENKLTIGTLGRISFQKNPTLFNEIALAFPNVQFLWIGYGELHSKITAPNIKVTGWFTNKEEGYNYLNEIDIYLQTSLWEGLPIAVLEAMAFKKPVVATNVIGNKDAVLNGETGFLFDTIEEASKVIHLLISDKGLRTKMGEKSLKRCEKLFDTEKNFNQLIDLYLSAVNNPL